MIDVKQEAVKLIAMYFGQNTADLYGNFYVGKADSVVVQSLKLLLTDFIGETKAAEQVNKIFPDHNIYDHQH
jgi:hypothetical protein